MKKKILKIDVADWLADIRLRLCSPAARALLIDIRCLSVPSGRLLVDGELLSDEQIGLLCGYSTENVKVYLEELYLARAYRVDDDGLFFPDMVKEYDFKQQAKVSGAKAARKPRRGSALEFTKHNIEPDPYLAGITAKNTSLETPAPTQPVAAPKPTAPAKKIADWWLTPAGWGRKGQEQAVSKGENESMLDFQIRIAKRLPDGPHLDVLPKHAAKAIRADIAEHAKRNEE